MIIPCYHLMLFAVVLFLFYILLRLNSMNVVTKKLQGIVGLFSFILIGYLSSQLAYDIHKPMLSSGSLSDATFYTATIDSRPTPTAKTNMYKVIINQLRTQDIWTAIHDKAILYFRNDTQHEFDYGDKLLIKGHPMYLESQKNPYAFDYSLYLQRRGIHLYGFVSEDDFVFINENHRAFLRYATLYIGDYFEGILSRHITSERELNMAKAMLIGRRGEITPEMEYAYASSGTSHILAVSGLHVGIVYLIFGSIFGFLKGSKLNLFYYGINLIAIWSFAIITGLSPSAQRAAIMLTFILVADFSRRKSSIYNTILASAFFILLVSPNLLFSVSFQLSYAAVFGIVYLYKRILGLVYIKNRGINYFWKISALSLSVQITTFPITIYYFNQFPVLFPFTNLFAIPTAMLTIVGGFLLLVTSQLGFIPTFTGYFLNGWIYFYNEIMVFVSNLSFASIAHLYLKPIYVFLIISCVFFVSQFIDTKKMHFLRYFSFVLIVFSGIVLIDHYQKSQQREVIFYHVNNKNYFDIFLGKNCYTNIKSTNVDIENEVNYNINPNRKHHLIEHVDDLKKLKIAHSIGSNTLIQWNNKTILVLNELQSLTKNHIHISVDYLVMGNKLIQDLPKIEKLFTINNLILDATVSQGSYEKVIRQVQGSETSIHSIKMDGAFKISI